ncbi:MAG: hypothetical protein WD231_03755 [Candidatus Woykebacteria bacterium]
MDPYQQTSGPNRFLVLLVGLVVGILISIGVFYVRAAFFTKEEEVPQTQSFKVTPTNELTLSLTSPTDGDTVATDSVKISGSTGKSSVVIVNGGSEDVIAEAKGGIFSINYNLELGENILTVVAYDEQSGESRTQDLNILYINENLETL